MSVGVRTVYCKNFLLYKTIRKVLECPEGLEPKYYSKVLELTEWLISSLKEIMKLEI
jgi:hypothetical protein